MTETFQIATELTKGTVYSLFGPGGISAIVLRPFATHKECLAGARAVQKLPATVDRGEKPGTFRTSGPSIGFASGDPEKMERYLAAAAATVGVTRLAFGGASPIDRLIAYVLEIWAPGIKIPHLNGRRYPSQHLREWRDGGATPAHIDRNKTAALPFNLKKRVACNVYIEVGGGEGGAGATEFWGTCDQAEYGRQEAAASTRAGYGLNREDLGPPQHVLFPKRGDVVMFDAGILHAVREVKDQRITNAAFFGFSGYDQPLIVFA